MRVIVGSQAHGLAGKNSDFDYRGVFVVPTSELLKVNVNIKNTHWIEGDDDNTSWEIGHFLGMAIHSNPTILETFLAPVVVEKTGSMGPSTLPHQGIKQDILLGEELRALFPYVWSSQRVRDAFKGYGHNQRKKMLEEKDKRPNKYAAAYLRVLYNAYELLNTGTFTIKITDTEVGHQIKFFKECEEFNDVMYGEVIKTTKHWEHKVDEAYEKNPNKETDIDKVNEFLLKVRKNNW